MKNFTYPVNHLSISSIFNFLNNPRDFEKKYIRNEFSEKKGYALAFGVAIHKAVEYIWNQGMGRLPVELEKVFSVFISCFDDMQDSIEYGKTQSYDKALECAENVLAEYLKKFFFIDKKTNTVSVEESIMSRVFDKKTGVVFDLPLKCKIDRLERRDGKIVPVDTKTCSTLTDVEILPIKYELQAAAIYFAVLEKYEEAIEYVSFEEVTKHKDPKSQYFDVEVTQKILWRFCVLYGNVQNNLAILYAHHDIADPFRQPFLPNPGSMFDGVSSWEDFCEYIDETQEDKTFKVVKL